MLLHVHRIIHQSFWSVGHQQNAQQGSCDVHQVDQSRAFKESGPHSCSLIYKPDWKPYLYDFSFNVLKNPVGEPSLYFNYTLILRLAYCR